MAVEHAGVLPVLQREALHHEPSINQMIKILLQNTLLKEDSHNTF